MDGNRNKLLWLYQDTSASDKGVYNEERLQSIQRPKITYFAQILVKFLAEEQEYRKA
jgi:hypothetical protein